MIVVWINGAFGAGKTTTARELIELIPNSTLFDPEVIGGTLPQLLPPKRLAEVGDFRDLPIWRRLVVDTAAAMLAELGGVLVVPMTLLRQEYRDEIFGGLAARRIPVRHVLLAPAETILRKRIAGREVPPELPDGEIRVRQWSYDHIEPYRAALASWLLADAHPVDTGALTPYEAALRIAEAVHTGDAPVCEIVQTPSPPRRPSPRGCCSSTSRTVCCSSTRRTRRAGNSPAASSSPAKRPRARAYARSPRRPACNWTTYPLCSSSTGSRPRRPASAACAFSSTAAGSTMRRSGDCCFPDPNCVIGASSVNRRRRICCHRCVTNGCGGRCGRGSVEPRCTWRQGFRSADLVDMR